MILRQDEPSCLSRHPIHLARAPAAASTARAVSDILISGLRVEGLGPSKCGSRQLVVQKMGFATVDR